MANTSPLPVVGQFQFYIVGDNRRSWAICHQHNLRSNTMQICLLLKPMDSIFDSTYQALLLLNSPPSREFSTTNDQSAWVTAGIEAAEIPASTIALRLSRDNFIFMMPPQITSY